MRACYVYTDGCCIRNGAKRPAAGYGIWWGENDHRNRYGPLRGVHPTSNKAELVAVKLAIEEAISLKLDSLTIFTDSRYVQCSLTLWIQKWKENGWKNLSGHHVKNQELIREINALMGLIVVDFQHVRGHADSHGNKRADALAKLGAQMHPNYKKKTC